MDIAKLVSEAVERCRGIGVWKLLFWLFLLIAAWFIFARSSGGDPISYVVPGSGI